MQDTAYNDDIYSVNVTNQHRWDSYGRFVEPLWSEVGICECNGMNQLHVAISSDAPARSASEVSSRECLNGTDSSEGATLTHVASGASDVRGRKSRDRCALGSNSMSSRAQWEFGTAACDHAPSFRSLNSNVRSGRCSSNIYACLLRVQVNSESTGLVLVVDTAEPQSDGTRYAAYTTRFPSAHTVSGKLDSPPGQTSNWQSGAAAVSAVCIDAKRLTSTTQDRPHRSTTAWM